MLSKRGNEVEPATEIGSRRQTVETVTSLYELAAPRAEARGE